MIDEDTLPWTLTAGFGVVRVELAAPVLTDEATKQLAEALLAAAKDAASRRIPDDGWFRVGDHDWATDRHVVVRRDALPPNGVPTRQTFGWARREQPHRRLGILADDIEARLTVPYDAVPHSGCFWPGYADLLASADIVLGSGPYAPAYLLRSGRVFAVVMPMLLPDEEGHADRARVDASGRPWEAP